MRKIINKSPIGIHRRSNTNNLKLTSIKQDIHIMKCEHLEKYDEDSLNKTKQSIIQDNVKMDDKNASNNNIELNKKDNTDEPLIGNESPKVKFINY